MIKLKKTGKPKPYIPAASMADIAFLLIIFFMVTTTFSKDRTSVNLPKTLVDKVEIPRIGTYITVDKDGNVFIDGKPNRMEDIETHASYLIARNKQHMFILKADKDTPYRNIDMALEQLRKSKAVNINLPSANEVLGEP